MENCDIDKLWERAYHHQSILREEIAEVRRRVRAFREDPSSQDYSDLQKLLEILGYTNGGDESITLLEEFLYYPAAPEVASTAIDALCNGFSQGLTKKYLDVLIAYLNGMDWDPTGECKFNAIWLLGHYAKDTHDKKSIAALLACVENPDEKNWDRELAYEFLQQIFTPNFQTRREKVPVSSFDPELLAHAHSCLIDLL